MKTAILFLVPISLAAAQEGASTTAMRRALIAEATSGVERAPALAALRSENASPAPWWQSGYVREGDSWRPYGDVIRATDGSKEQEAYERRWEKERGKDMAAAHVRLARWCKQNGRQDQCRAHTLAAIEANPSLATVPTLRSIGFVQVLGQWVPPETAYRIARDRLAIDRSLDEWGQALTAIRRGLRGNPNQSRAAKARLASIESADAVDAIEAILGRTDCEREAVDTLARIPSARSSLLLAGHAVFSPAITIRQTATKALKNRPFEESVPDLLEELAPEITIDVASEERSLPSPTGMVRLPRFSTGFVVRLRQETNREVYCYDTVVDTVFHGALVADPEVGGQPDLRYGGSVLTPKGYAKLQHISEHREQALRANVEAQVSRFNQRTRFRNNRVYCALKAITDQDGTESRFWRDWWTRYSDVEAPQKYVAYTQTYAGRTYIPMDVSPSCFVAGTPVITKSGTRSIEKLRIGDRVLSQDVETGELGFRVVQRTTVRPPRETVVLAFGSDKVQSTGGHNFWKVGAGWVKARDLKAGDRIRTPKGTAAISAVSDGGARTTHNLVVEGFHTYFVGESGLLVQDVLPITPTDMASPGLSRFELTEKPSQPSAN